MDKILTEIGELFARYRDEQGNLDFFQNKMRNSRGQVIADYNQFLSYHTRNAAAPDPEINKFLNSVLQTNFNGTPGRRFYGWQVRVLERLQNKENDVYVVAPPGGGKTTPLMAHYMVDVFMGGEKGSMTSLHAADILGNTPHPELVDKWADIFHSLLSGKRIDGQFAPRCLFVTPIRVLAFEQAEGFQDYFLDILLFLKSLLLKIPRQNNNEDFQAYMTRIQQNPNDIDKIIAKVFGSLGEQMFHRINQNPKSFGSWVKQFTENIICVKTGGGSGNFNCKPDDAIVTIATYGSAKNFISSVSNKVKFIVFDEAHLYMVRPDRYINTMFL